MSRTLGKLVLGYATRRNSNQTAKNLPILHSTTTTTIIRPFSSFLDGFTADDTAAPVILNMEQKEQKRISREASMRRLNGDLIQHYIDAANNEYNERVALGLFNKAVMVYKSMINERVYAGERLYGPLLKFVTMRTMSQQFYSLCDDIKKEDPTSLPKKQFTHRIPKLTYYELLFWIKIESEIWKVCDGAERQEKMSMLLETIDIQKFCSKENVEIMFKLMGRLSLESHAKKFLLELKRNDKNNVRGTYISTLIYIYATSIPNIQIEDIVARFQTLQAESELASLCARFEKLKLIKACCDSLKVDLAIDLVDSLVKVDFDVTVDVWNSLLTACDRANDCRLVHRIYSMMKDRDICPNQETFRVVISLCGKMEGFHGAYRIIEKLKKSDKIYPDCVYKAVLLGYFQKFQRNNQRNKEQSQVVVQKVKRKVTYPHEINWIFQPLRLAQLESLEKFINKYY